MALYTADFETTTDENDCRVWAWGVCSIDNPDVFIHGNNLETFIDFIANAKNSTFYFHNLKFDGEFIIAHLFENGFKHIVVEKPGVKNSDKRSKKDFINYSKYETPKAFTTLISDKGQFYAMKVIFEKTGKKSKTAQIYDSLKILPFSVEEIAKAFGLPIMKLEIDYSKPRPVGYELSIDEIAYLKNDVEIMARALKILFSQNLKKMTQGSNALFDYKNTITEKTFERAFPIPDYDRDVRQSYKGGFTYLNPKYKNKDVKTGLVFDVNSLYPWVLRDCLLPYGDGIYFDGKYEYDDLYPLYVQMIECQFEMKPGHIPTIQLKNNLSFIPTEYITSSKDEYVTMCLTSVDLDLFLEHYDVYNLEYISGWKFKGSNKFFREYIDKWMKVKIESTLNGNKAMRTLAKLMLNALYGKFGLNPNVQSKIPYYDNGKVAYTFGDKETRNPIYIPVATFVTAYARRKTITTAQKVYDRFIYADTDSLHLDIELPEELRKMSAKDLEKLTVNDLRGYGIQLPDGFDVDPVALGSWKLESKFERARFIRQKCYIEDNNAPETWDNENYNSDLLNITCAGMPSACYEYVTWENFREGSTFYGKLQPKHVPGGIVLKETEFTIQKLS